MIPLSLFLYAWGPGREVYDLDDDTMSKFETVQRLPRIDFSGEEVSWNELDEARKHTASTNTRIQRNSRSGQKGDSPAIAENHVTGQETARS